MVICENKQERYVIVVKRGNIDKYIAKDYFGKKHINCTIKINKAKQFKSAKLAMNFWNDWHKLDTELEFVTTKKLVISYKII